MKARLTDKLRADSDCGEFILADARDADMAFGISSPGALYPPRNDGPEFCSMSEFHEQIRAIVKQDLLDIMLASVSTMSRLAFEERIFDGSQITPAIRANDATDVWVGRGARYRESGSRPFATCFIDEAQFGNVAAERRGEPVVNLGLYSITFNNDVDLDLASLEAF